MDLDADAIVDRRRLKRRVALWRSAAILLGALILLLIVSPRELGVRDHVARLTIADIIVEDRELIDAIEALAENDRAKAVIVRIDSPGGTTGGSEELYHALRRVGEHKPVIGVIGGVGASGAYIAALATDRILARETSITGSIGVMFQVPEVSRLMDKLGVGVEQVASGPLKGEPSSFAPMSDAAREVYQGIVADTYRWFVALVAARRGLDRADAIRLADGRVYTGRQALEAGLIDALGGESEAMAWLSAERQIDGSLPIVDVETNPADELLIDILSLFPGKTLLPERLTLDGLVSVWHPTP